MRVAILAGGRGTRLAPETHARPKGMVEIGGTPIIWHIMKYYAQFGHSAFVLALGYRSDEFRRFFTPEAAPESGAGTAGGSFDGMTCSVELVDTGNETQTGGRIKRLADSLGSETFMLTWCDGLADIDLGALLAFHRSHGRLATLTAVHPRSQFGQLQLDASVVTKFTEKPERSDAWINGAFFVLEPGVFDYIAGDETDWDRECLTALASDGQLMAYKHESFWRCMDTLKDKEELEAIWNTENCPWRILR